MSRDRGRAATIAAVTGAGNGGLRDRLPTAAAQATRLADLKAQLQWYEQRRDGARASEVRAEIRQVEALMRGLTA